MNKGVDQHRIHRQRPVKQWRKRYRRFVWVSGMIALILMVAVFPVRAAERVYFNYGPLGFSISVQSLETFADEGKIESDTAFILNRLAPEQREWLRNLLNSHYQFESVAIARFFYSSLGERLLTYLGELLQTQGGRNGFYGIRAALIQATAEPDGLSVINFMHKFPTNIRLNTNQIMRQVKHVSTLINDTKAFVETLEQETAKAAASEPPIDLTSLPDLQAPGGLSYTKQTRTLYDPTRQREFFVDLYLPTVANGVEIPVIAVSNGIGTRIDRYDYLAEHLASYGFAVVIPQHPGSDDQQQQAFLQGLSGEMFETSAFIDRPLDVTYLLDELERLNLSEFNGQLNLQQVGIFGNSFGGNTALSLAGADIDFVQLEHDCNPQRPLVNISLLIQCQALKLPQTTTPLQDSRIKAVSVLFPGGSSLFGQTGLSQVNVPVLWGAASQDIFSPLVVEQAPAFHWLATPDKYLAVTAGVDHLNLNFYAIRNLSSLDEASRETFTTNEPEIVKVYLKALSLAFFQVYIANRSQYRPYLTASYTQSISETPYRLSLVRSLTDLLPEP